mmetsp:Transcript_27119/g.50832  ORF Transcript_27119/g.50832 Transcript_27119/m.50832 type:complete len:184 (+) Transcript_27119:124-675(+)
MASSSEDYLAAARAAAARTAATAVLAGRSAAAAARSQTAGNSSLGGFRNQVANRAMAAAALRAATSFTSCTSPDSLASSRGIEAAQAPVTPSALLNVTLESSKTSVPATMNHSSCCHTTVVHATPSDSDRDDSKLCEWDVKVQRTFITVVPMRKQLTHTASAPARLVRPHPRRRRMRPSRRRR